MSIFYGGTRGDRTGDWLGPIRITRNADRFFGSLTIRLTEYVADLRRDFDRAFAMQDAFDDLRERAVGPRAVIPPLGNYELKPRYVRRPRSGLPAAYSFYQGAF